MLYILDEPSIGLHQRDNRRLSKTLKQLRDLGNTVIVVEHDEETIRAADHILELGPGPAGRAATSSLPDASSRSWRHRARYGRLSAGEKRIAVPTERRAPKPDHELVIAGAREHNLKNVTARIPLGCFVAVTGVSGSGKSTLINDILWKSLSRRFYRAKLVPGVHDRVSGLS